EQSGDAAGVGVGGAVSERGPAGSWDAGEAEGVVDPDGPEVGPVGAGGPQDVGFDGGRDQVALPLQDRGNYESVGLEGPRWAEGEHRVALLHGQVQPAEKTIPNSVAPAQDDAPPPGPQDQHPPQLPPARPRSEE